MAGRKVRAGMWLPNGVLVLSTGILGAGWWPALPEPAAGQSINSRSSPILDAAWFLGFPRTALPGLKLVLRLSQRSGALHGTSRRKGAETTSAVVMNAACGYLVPIGVSVLFAHAVPDSQPWPGMGFRPWRQCFSG
ncbi:hypothetical protein [Arthrobacter sp. AQ5-05]|uniref:hypothetical protein n=1 Tax=Arthrobacter sp. AQ5-05 TaxID=2184581 RepID=UPI0011BEDF08|nr:hypothetical protein [Arthrobacter sp. AQ5-05]